MFDDDGEITDEEFEELIETYNTAAMFTNLLVTSLNDDKMEVVCYEKELADTITNFIQRLHQLTTKLDKDGRHRYTKIYDSASGSSETNSWEESGVIRPSGRKLH